ncbi:unnamed protein product [Mytilus edulis]|uniref:C-type lectin domain-containing protein n=1 Tax=Mytilus edulis TaxID=6550 RepID=A0A8S3QI69_MYTED|nr:unnamed protein product [Mytilus edulis]
MSAYTAQFIPSFILEQNPIDQQQDVILLDDRESSALALLMIPMVMMTMMSTTETPMPVVPTSVSVTVPTPQAVVPTMDPEAIGESCLFIEFTNNDWVWENQDCDDDERFVCEFPRNPIDQQQDVILLDDRESAAQCVPTNCPANYRLLNDQTASSNCYFDSGTQSDLIWSDARLYLLIIVALLHMSAYTAQLIPSFILEQNPIDQQQDVILLDDRESAAQCVPTNCPANYRLLNDQTASSNCYFDSGTQADQIWSNARIHLWKGSVLEYVSCKVLYKSRISTSVTHKFTVESNL